MLAGALLSPVLPLATLAGHYAAGLERVRRTLGVRLAARELSLATLHDVGETAARASDEYGVEASLVLLGRVVDAHAVALLRASPDGRLDGSRVDWRPHGELAAVDTAVAEQVLQRKALRSLDGVPGRAGAVGRAIYAPLLAGRLPVGVLVVESRNARELSEVELRTIGTVASQLALTVRSLRLVEELRAVLDASVEAIASAVEARDGYTEMHCRRLALFSVSMARRLSMSPEEIEAIRLGALLHDVGKIGVPDHILLKAGRFSPDERAQMERHVEIGHRILRPISGLSATTSACVRHHHEKWDGTGYPDGLAREAIPLGARIVAVVDVWDALSTARPYKPAFSQAKVREILEKDRGTHFDPALVDLFFQVLEDEGDEMLALIAASETARS
jgi:putative nucleotidyltransferase with HDIG domain